MGKVVIIKIVVLPLFFHLFSSLPNPSRERAKRLQRMLYAFIWSGKIDRIKRSSLICDYNEDGLTMIHVESFIDYLKAKCIKRILAGGGQWLTLFRHMRQGGDGAINSKAIEKINSKHMQSLLEGCHSSTNQVENGHDFSITVSQSEHIELRRHCRIPTISEVG